MPDERPKLVIITGPTAAGKSSLAVDLAIKFGGEIINADSMQVYRGMDVGTAKPSIEERRGIIHHMIDVVDPDEDFNASVYRTLAGFIIKEITERKKICFVVGGTGLYIKTLLGGLFKCPSVDGGIREELIRECEEIGLAHLHKRLKRLDPESAKKIHPNDKTRIIRALEIIKVANKPLSAMILQHGFKDRAFRAIKICLQIDREQLYNRINERVLSMIESGLVEETMSLLSKGYSPELRSMKSIGYRHVIGHLEGICSLERTILQIQRDTRRYSKRQLTWFRADPEMVWAEPVDRHFIEKKIKKFV